jgi:MFS family permease
MNELQQNFRDRLLAAEKSTPSEKYRKDLANLRVRKMSRAQRVAMIAPMLFCVAAAIRMASPALNPPQNLPMLARIGLGVGAVGSLVWAVLMGIVVKRGVIRRKSDPVVMNRILVTMFAVATGIAGFLALGMPDRARGTQVLVVEAILLLIASVFLIQSLIEQAELRTREKLLELEMQMQEVAEQLRQSADTKH